MRIGQIPPHEGTDAMQMVPWMLRNVPILRLKRLIWSFVRRRRFDFDTRTFRGWHVRGNTTDWIQRTLYYFGVWEPNLSAWLERRLSEGDVFVDVGANIGYFSMLAAGRVGPKGAVIAVEPMPEIFQQLTHHIAANALRNVRLINEAAVGPGQTGTVTLYRGEEENLGSSSMLSHINASGAFTVPARPLAQMLTDEECRRARVIKIDVEGVETAAVLGLKLDSDRFRDDIELVVEINPDAKNREEERTILLRHMEELGFNIYGLRENVTFREHLPKYAHRLVPVRIRGELPPENNFIFSRIDSETL